MEIQPLNIVLHIINIFVTFILLRLILYKPVSKLLHDRSASISKLISDAETEKADAQKLKAEYETHMQQVQQDASSILTQANQKANTDAAGILKNANRQAGEIIEESRKLAESNRLETINGLQQQITDLSVSLASEILKREISETDNQHVIDDFFAQVR